MHDMLPVRIPGLYADGSDSETRVRCVPGMSRVRLLFQCQDLDVLAAGVGTLEHSGVESGFGVPTWSWFPY
jgi:hypothetical protein